MMLKFAVDMLPGLQFFVTYEMTFDIVVLILLKTLLKYFLISRYVANKQLTFHYCLVLKIILEKRKNEPCKKTKSKILCVQVSTETRYSF